MYVIIEGPNCSGKTTLIKSLQENDSSGRLITLKQDVSLRSFVLAEQEHRRTGNPSDLIAWHMRFYADKIRKYGDGQLSEHKIVVMDRFFPSLTAYQHVHPYRTLGMDWGDFKLVVLPVRDINDVLETYEEREGPLNKERVDHIVYSQKRQKEGYDHFIEVMMMNPDFNGALIGVSKLMDLL